MVVVIHWTHDDDILYYIVSKPGLHLAIKWSRFVVQRVCFWFVDGLWNCNAGQVFKIVFLSSWICDFHLQCCV